MKIWQMLVNRGPIVWFRNLFYIVSNYRDDLIMVCNGVDECHKRVNTTERYVKKVTKLHVDVPASMKDATTVIVVGTYRGRDHVQVFQLRPGSIDALIYQLKDLQRYSQIGRIGAPLEIDATIKRSLVS